MSRADRPRVAILMQGGKDDPRIPRVSPLTSEIVARLQDQGVIVDSIIPGSGIIDIAAIRPTHDLYVLKEKNALNLSFAGVLELSGAQIVNTVRSCVIARDKIAATALVAAAGVPVPPSWTTGNTKLLGDFLENGPIWLKPQRGSRGFGVRRITSQDNLTDQEITDHYGLPLPVFAQREVPSDGQDFKVYVVGEKVWALRRSFPALSLEEKLGRAVGVPRAIKDAAIACGEALGLEIYGVDFLVQGSEFSVVDVNAFPGFKGIAAAPSAIADYLYRKARPAWSDAERAEMAL